MNGNPNWFINRVRELFAALDSFGYWILSGVYKIFFAVSSAEILSGEVVAQFFSRVQLILGIIVVFKLAFTALNVIINPELATDKQKGAGKIITRVAAALLMLTLIVPFSSIPAEEEGINGKIRDHGILFGFLYQFQDRMMKENILGKLILGSRASYGSSDENGLMNEGGEIDNMSDIGDVMAATVAKAFVYPTINEEYNEDNIREDEELSAALACDNEATTYYMNPDATASGILDHITDSCGHFSGQVYAYHYTILGGLICSIIMTIIIVGFTIDVAVRAIKLAVLRLIAPVPIISYISPGSEKDGAFGNWVKTLISTYIDLFIRLAIIYFGAYLIILVSQSIGTDGINIIQTDYGFVTNFLATIFIIIGILVFMKQAPKFLKDALGIKGAPMGNAGLSGIMGGLGAFVGGAGLAGAGAAMVSGISTGAEAAAQGKPAGLGWSQGRDLAAQIRTGDPKAKGGIVNSLNDRLMRSAGISRARKIYGVTSSGVNEAQTRMFKAQEEAALAHNIADRVRENGWDSLSASEQAAIEDTYRKKLGIQGDLTAEQIADMQNQGATMYAYDRDAAYGKAKSYYDKVSQFADSHRITESFEEKYRRSARDSIGDKFRAIRHPITSFRSRDNNRGEHPGAFERATTNRRWTPSGDSGSGNINRYQDNPDRNIDAPTAGGNNRH